MSVYLIEGGAVRAVATVPAELPTGVVMVRQRQDLVATKALTVAELARLAENLEVDPPTGKARTRAVLIDLVWPVMRQLQPAPVSAAGRKAAAKVRAVAPAATEPPVVAGRPTRVAQILTALQQPGGVAIADLASQLGWHRHSVHGVLSGVVKKKLGHKVASTKGGDGIRRYSLVA